MSEYNQCQTQLFNLFGEDPSHKERIYFEFVSYRILYCIITEDTASMYSFLASLKPKDFENSLIQNALRIQTAFASLDYHQFFVRYRSSSFLAKCLIKDVLHIVRYRALCIICKAYLQVPVSFVQEELGFEDLTECLEFLLAAGIQLDQANDKILCKSSSVVAVPKVRSKAPVDSAVTHGSFH